MKPIQCGWVGKASIAGRWVAVTLALVAAGAAVAAVSPPRPVHTVDEPVAYAAASAGLVYAGGVSDDGRRVVLGATADYLAGDDHNRAADVILFDRTEGTLNLVSVNRQGSNGGNGTSLSPALSADGSRIAFQSRANDLVAGDDNARYDVFIRDLETSTTRLVSASTNGVPGNGPSGSPQLSADGRYLMFESLAQTLVASAGIGRQWYRRDLTTETTVGVARGIAGAGAMTDARLSAEGRWVAANVTVNVGSRQLPQVHRIDAETGLSDLLSLVPSPVPSAYRYDVGPPVLTPDGACVAFLQTDGLTGSTLSTNSVVWCSAVAGTTRIVDQTTNAWPSGGLDFRRAEVVLTPDGGCVVYSLPEPAPSEGTVAVSLRLWTAATTTSRLVTVSTNGVSPSAGQAVALHVSGDARFVVFSSDASDLAPEATNAVRRVYLWDAESGQCRVVSEPAGPESECRVGVSANGAWLAVAETEFDGGVTVVWVDLLTGQAQRIPAPAAAKRSATPRAWVGLRPAAASADGRYLALLSSGEDPAAGYVQVVVRDTLSGESWLASARPDGQPADRNCSAVSMDASGRWVAFVTAAVLDAADSDATADVFLCDRETATTRALSVSLRDGGRAREPVLLSPDGRFVHFGWVVTTETAAYVCEAATGRMEKLRTANAIIEPCFSADGRFFAASFTAATPRSEVYDLSAWFAENPMRTVYYGLNNRGYCVLSGDGQRLGVLSTGATGVTRTVQVVDLPAGLVRMSYPITNSATAGIAVDGTGERLAWSVLDTTPRQIWTARIEEVRPTLVSVAPDQSTPGDGGSRYPVLTPDGRRIAFVSDATNLVEDDTNGVRDVFVRDLETGRTVRASRGATGDSGSGWSVAPIFSGNGRVLFFTTHAANLLPYDYNDAGDVVCVDLSDDLLLTLERAPGAATARLRWNGAPGSQCRVEAAADLPNGPWQTLAEGVEAGTGFEIDLGASERRFYRVTPLR